MIYIGQNQLGKPYIYGANGTSSYDCTGFTCYCFKQLRIKLKRSAVDQGYDDTYPKITSISDLRRGDLVFFNTISDNDLSDHAGIYLGAGYFIHASSGQGRVVISTLASGYYNRVFSWVAAFSKAERAVPADTRCRAGLHPVALAAALDHDGFESGSDSKPAWYEAAAGAHQTTNIAWTTALFVYSAGGQCPLTIAAAQDCILWHLLPRLITTVLSREATQNLRGTKQQRVPIKPQIAPDNGAIRLLSWRAVPADDCCRAGLHPVALAAALDHDGFESGSDSKPVRYEAAAGAHQISK